MTCIDPELNGLPNPSLIDIWVHHNGVIMRAMASEITSLATVYSTVYSRRRYKKIPKLRVSGLCEGNSLVTGEFPAQRSSDVENVSIWWRHHVLCLFRLDLLKPTLDSRNHATTTESRFKMADKYQRKVKTICLYIHNSLFVHKSYGK